MLLPNEVEYDDEGYAEWQRTAVKCMEQLKARSFELKFSGGNDSGGIDEATLQFENGVEIPVDVIDGMMHTYVPIQGMERPVHYKPLIHPRQYIINELIEAAWTPIGRAHGSFATSDDSNVSGSVYIDMTAEDPHERFQVDEGEWITTHWCGRCGQNTVDGEDEVCGYCSGITFCTACEYHEAQPADGPDGLCSECREMEDADAST